MRITRVQLTCHNTEQQLDFYIRSLGLQLVDGAVMVGSNRLAFVAGQKHRYHLAFNWPRNQWENGIEWLSQRTQLVRDSQGQSRFEFENWQARSVYFWDPAGNLLEAIVRDRLELERAQPEWLSVSEVGLVVPDVPALSRQLALPVFGPCREDFCALGDDQGLLILARQGRTWYPTQDFAAASAPLWVEWEGGQCGTPAQAEG